MKKVLVIVAHPDDEILWMGGTLLRHKKDWQVTTVCLTRKSDSDREPKFWKVRNVIGDNGFIYDFDDTSSEPWDRNEIIKILKKYSDEEYDYLFTHGANGESGHIRHKEIHKAVKEMIHKGLINARKVFFFSYLFKENEHQGYCIYNSNANILINLNTDELAMKRKLAVDVYGYNRGGIGFEENSVGSVEAFDRLK